MNDDIIITVSGGVADLLQNPSNHRVIIRDYDVEDCDDSRLKEDENGDEYIEMVFDGEG